MSLIQHPYSEILHALADGHKVRLANGPDCWMDQSPEDTLRQISNSLYTPDLYQIERLPKQGQASVSTPSKSIPDFSHNIMFCRDGVTLGILDLSGPEMTFKGKADESAQVFFETVLQRSKQERDKQSDLLETLRLVFESVGYSADYAIQWPKEKASVTFKRWFDEQPNKYWDAFVEEWRKECGVDNVAVILCGVDKLKAVYLRAVASSAPTDPKLLKFYNVSTDADLIAAQAHHIERLQAKLDKPSSATQPYQREG